MKSILLLFLFFALSISVEGQAQHLPEGFVYVQREIPGINSDLRYAGKNNFIGREIPGYKKPVPILSAPAASALKKAQKELVKKGYSFKLFDAYRPQRAVDYFVQWSGVAGDTLMKNSYYPNVKKENLFRLGYIATQSGHSRGSTVDLTIVATDTGKELDMGSSYDFFGDISAHNAVEITAKQANNRKFLKDIMIKYGFQPYTEEWWHYALRKEPYPNTYFDFPVK